MHQSISFPNHNISYLAPSWEEIDDVCLTLAGKIAQSEKKFDRLVTLAKGGWPMSRSLLDFLHIKEVASIGVRFYAGINTRLTEPKIYQELPVVVKGEDVLLFDDVADSGESLVFTKAHLLELGVKSVTTATLYYKPHSVYKPDFFGLETTAWIIFPFEIMESIAGVLKKWQETALLKEDEQREILAKLGIKPALIDYYFSQYLAKLN